MPDVLAADLGYNIQYDVLPAHIMKNRDVDLAHPWVLSLGLRASGIGGDEYKRR